MAPVDPMVLLNCLRGMLNEDTGGFKGSYHAIELARLMPKFSTKSVGRIIYITILKKSTPDLLKIFMDTNGWCVMYKWLKISIETDNIMLIQDILTIFTAVPATVDRLRINGLAKLVKFLSKSHSYPEISSLAQELVMKWLVVIRTRDIISVTNNKESLIKRDTLDKENNNAGKNLPSKALESKLIALKHKDYKIKCLKTQGNSKNKQISLDSQNRDYNFNIGVKKINDDSKVENKYSEGSYEPNQVESDDSNISMNSSERKEKLRYNRDTKKTFPLPKFKYNGPNTNIISKKLNYSVSIPKELNMNEIKSPVKVFKSKFRSTGLEEIAPPPPSKSKLQSRFQKKKENHVMSLSKAGKRNLSPTFSSQIKRKLNNSRSNDEPSQNNSKAYSDTAEDITPESETLPFKEKFKPQVTLNQCTSSRFKTVSRYTEKNWKEVGVKDCSADRILSITPWRYLDKDMMVLYCCGNVVPGIYSHEKITQTLRERSVPAVIYSNKNLVPDSPEEPDEPEISSKFKTMNIPFDGNSKIYLRPIRNYSDWPKAKGDQPQSIPVSSSNLRMAHSNQMVNYNFELTMAQSQHPLPPPMPSQQLPLPPKQPQLLSQRPPSPPEQPQFSPQWPPSPPEQPPLLPQRPPSPPEQPPLSPQRPPSPPEQPPLSSQQPPLPPEQPPLPSEKPPLPPQQPPLPPLPLQQPPLPPQQPPLPPQQPPLLHLPVSRPLLTPPPLSLRPFLPPPPPQQRRRRQQQQQQQQHLLPPIRNQQLMPNQWRPFKRSLQFDQQRVYQNSYPHNDKTMYMKENGYNSERGRNTRGDNGNLYLENMIQKNNKKPCSPSGPAPKKFKALCRYYAKGYCRYSTRCAFTHAK